MIYFLLPFLFLATFIEGTISTPLVVEEHKAKKKIDPFFDKNPLLTGEEKKLARPYIIPLTHSLRKTLDELFIYRPTRDYASLVDGGFSILCHRPRSFIYVVSHPKLPGYLLKLYLDTELRIKDKTPGWKWFVYRCQGRERIQKVIEKKKLRYFVVPWKGLYPLPPKNLPPKDPKYDLKHTVLVAEKMNLVPKQENLRLWKEAITKEHLRELYTIIKTSSSIRSRPDNMHFTTEGRIAIIDTEYPHNKPDLVSIIPYLNPEMALFWKKLIKK